MKNITAFLRDTEVAVRYGVSRPTIWRWTKNGNFPNQSNLELVQLVGVHLIIEAWEQ